MNQTVLEVVEFRVNGDAADLCAAAREMHGWLHQQPGFNSRRLAALGDGLWIDCVEWADMESAKAAAATIMTTAAAKNFLSLIDGPSVMLRHAEIAVTS